MNIYNYDEKTKEYLSTTIAEADPEETKLKGKFVPLVPANATLIEVPEYGENEIPVFENENWVIKPDYRINFYKVDDNLSVQEIKTIGDQEGCYIVDKTTGDLIKQNPDKFKIVDNQVIAKTDDEYQAEQEEIEKNRIAMLNLTAADVERAIYKVKGMDFDDVVSLVETQSLSEDDKPSIDIKALKIELRANNFYRGNPYINTVGTLLGFSEKQMDEFFETNDYTKLLEE